MTDPNPVHRLRAVREAICAETARLPAVDANGQPIVVPPLDDSPMVNLTTEDADDPQHRATEPLTRIPKPDPTQGGKSDGPIDSAARAMSEGRVLDAIRMTRQESSPSYPYPAA